MSLDFPKSSGGAFPTSPLGPGNLICGLIVSGSESGESPGSSWAPSLLPSPPVCAPGQTGTVSLKLVPPGDWVNGAFMFYKSSLASLETVVLGHLCASASPVPHHCLFLSNFFSSALLWLSNWSCFILFVLQLPASLLV